MGSCLRVASSQHDSQPFQTTAIIKVAQYRGSLTMAMLEPKPNIELEASSSYSWSWLRML